MELNMSEKLKQIVSALLLLIIPLLVILTGVILNILNVWYYVLAVTWFGMGIIFFSALKE